MVVMVVVMVVMMVVVRPLEDFSLYIFQDYNSCFLLFDHNWSCTYCCSCY